MSRRRVGVRPPQVMSHLVCPAQPVNPLRLLHSVSRMATRGVVSAGRRLLGARINRIAASAYSSPCVASTLRIACSATSSSLQEIAGHRRLLSSASSGDDKKSVDGKAQHALFEEQMRELRAERDVMFGPGGGNERSGEDGNRPPVDMYEPGSSTSTLEMSDAATSTLSKPDDADEEIEKMHETRAKVYGFTSEDYAGWTNAGANHTHDESFMEKLQAAREEQERTTVDDHTTPKQAQPKSKMVPKRNENNETFTHLAPSGDAVSMVDVGAKAVTTRMAKARTHVIFPPEVIEAFRSHESSNEMVGPKGPIFATAKIAGVMAAKRTSDLIPLCHPLPLDKVNIDIQFDGKESNTAIVECECRVTHKTGVEMEALTGATVAALTIYDMCKAVSHNIEIGSTMLIEKSGGKRTVKEQELLKDR